jgi:RND family efflux transporter MFP subunit
MKRIEFRRPWLPLASIVLWLAAAVPAAGLVVLGKQTPDPDALPASPALGVEALRAEPADGYALRRVFAGRVEASRSGSLGFERAGLLAEVLVKEGDVVAAGQVLARLDTALLEAGRRELAAALAAAEADLALAESTLERHLASVEDGAVTRQSLDEARERARAARAGAELERARIASLDLDLSKSELRAPFAGTVVRRAEDEGRVLAAGAPVVALQEAAAPEIRVGLAGPLVDSMTPGGEYRFAWRGERFDARLRALLPLRAAGARTLDALFVPLDPPAGLRPGELVELVLSERVPEPGLWLPLSALAEGARGLWRVYALEPLSATRPNGLVADHRIAPVAVEVIYQEGDRVYVRGPLRRDGLLVRGGLQRVVPGQLVRLLPAAEDRVAMEGR